MKTFGILLFVCSVACGSRLRRQNYDPSTLPGSCAAVAAPNNFIPYAQTQGNFPRNSNGNQPVFDPARVSNNGNNYNFNPNNNQQGQRPYYPINQPNGGNGFNGNNNNVGQAQGPGYIPQQNQNYYNGPPVFNNGQGYNSPQVQGQVNGPGFNQGGVQGPVNGPGFNQGGVQGLVNGPGYNQAPPQGPINNGPGFNPTQVQRPINNGPDYNNPGQFQGPINGQGYNPTLQAGQVNGGFSPALYAQGPGNNGNDYAENRQSPRDNLIGYSSGGRGVYYFPNLSRNPNQNSNFDNSNNADSFFRPQIEDPFIVSSLSGGR